MSDSDPESKIRQLMRESVPKSSKVVDFAAAARKRGRPVRPARVTPVQSIQITGNNNAGVIGDNAQVHINISSPLRKTAAVAVQPGPQHINAAQAAEVQELVKKVVATTGRTYEFVWGTVKRKYRFARYELIDQETYEQVCKYLRKWIGSATLYSAPADTELKRKQHLKRIHAQARKTPGVLDHIHFFVRGRFGTASLSELMPGQLLEVIKEFKL